MNILFYSIHTNHKLYQNLNFSVCIVLYLRLFSNVGDKTHPFTIGLYDTFMQK